MKKIIIVLIILLITFTLPTFFASNATAQEKPLLIEVSQVKSVSMNQADLTKLPLFADREEDTDKITSLTKLLNEVITKSEVYAEYEPLSHFSTGISLQMRDGTFYSFTFEGGGIVFFHEGVPYRYVSGKMNTELYSYLISTTQNYIEQTNYRIGDTIHKFGDDAALEKGMMMTSLTPIQTSGRYSSEDPSYSLMFTAPITYSRYDFTLPIPAFVRNKSRR